MADIGQGNTEISRASQVEFIRHLDLQPEVEANVDTLNKAEEDPSVKKKEHPFQYTSDPNQPVLSNPTVSQLDSHQIHQIEVLQSQIRPSPKFDKELQKLTPEQTKHLPNHFGLTHKEQLGVIRLGSLMPSSIPQHPEVAKIIDRLHEKAGETRKSPFEQESKSLSPEESYQIAFEAALGQITPQQIAQLPNGAGMTLEQAKGAVRFAHAHPNDPIDPVLRTLTQSVESIAAKHTIEQQKLPSDWSPPSSDGQQYDRFATRINEWVFDEAVQEQLPPGEAEKYQYARYHPEAKSSWDPEKKATMERLETNSMESTRQVLGFPQEWAPPKNSSELESKVAASKEMAFYEALSKATEERNLTPREVATLRRMHAYPETISQAEGKLQALYYDLNEQSQEEVKSRFGIPPQTALQANPEVYQAWLSGQAAHKFHENLKKIDPNIKPEEKQQLKEAYADSTKSPPEHLEATFQQAKKSSTEEVKSNNQLPSEWEPKVSPPPASKEGQQSLEVSVNGANYLKEAHALMGKALESTALQRGIGGEIGVLTFWKAIGNSLDKLLDCLYAQMSSDSVISKKFADMQLEAAMNKLEAQRVALAKMAEAQREVDQMSGFQKFMNILMDIFLVVFGGLPALFLVIDKEANLGITQRAFDSLTQSIMKAMPSFFPTPLKILVTAMVKFFLLVALTPFIGPVAAMMLFFDQARIIQDVVKACGGNEQDQQIAVMVAQLLLQIAILVAICVVTAGAAAPEAGAAAGAGIAGVSSAIVAETTVWALSLAMNALSLILAGLQIAAGITQIITQVNLAKIALLKGKFDSEMNMIETNMAIIQQIIKKMMQEMNRTGEWIKNISTMENTMFTQLSRTLNKLYQA